MSSGCLAWCKRWAKFCDENFWRGFGRNFVMKFFGGDLGESAIKKGAFKKDVLKKVAPILRAFNFKMTQYEICALGGGAMEAIAFALNAKTRINRIILIAPKFKKSRNDNAESRTKFAESTPISPLRDLQSKSWQSTKNKISTSADSTICQNLERLRQKGIEIIVFLDGSTKDSANFFAQYGIVYFIKNTNFA
ncbi:hypothetical protein ACWIUD_04800 [Helicobacter sp. 23-1044]